MTTLHVVDRPAFTVAGKKTWISGPDNEQFGEFWQRCRADGLLDRFNAIKSRFCFNVGAQTNSGILGISRVERDPAIRSFHYMIAIEVPPGTDTGDLEVFEVPACTWAVVKVQGLLPGALVEAELYAFMQWLPQSGFRHALAPEMEVYPPYLDQSSCEFWLPVERHEKIKTG